VLLLNSLYTIISITGGEKGMSASILLHPDHIIFSGHFPGHPVMPGVVQLQIVHELLEYYFERKMKLQELIECKFLKILDPSEHSTVEIEIECSVQENMMQVKAVGKMQSETFLKLKCKYILV
jgi:3-hydroxyacyl-[acyl-carrier-protein] dehydratase